MIAQKKRPLDKQAAVEYKINTNGCRDKRSIPKIWLKNCNRHFWSWGGYCFFCYKPALSPTYWGFSDLNLLILKGEKRVKKIYVFTKLFAEKSLTFNNDCVKIFKRVQA